MGKELIGKITNYYDKIGVAVLELTADLKEGDKIRIEKDGEGFEQVASSMQIDKDNIKEAKAGQAIGIRLDKPVKGTWEVFRVTE